MAYLEPGAETVESEVWTERRVAILTQLWNNGNTCSQIRAHPLMEGLTKNQIIGKVHRLKLKMRPNPARPKGSRKKEQRGVRNPWAHKVRRSRADNFHTPKTTQGAVNWLKNVTPYAFNESIRFRKCQFIEGEPFSLKCGAPVRLGSSYCEAHHVRCYVEKNEQSH